MKIQQTQLSATGPRGAESFTRKDGERTRAARARLFARLAMAGFSVLAFSACMLLAGGSSSTETGDKVALSGRVTGGNGDGIPGVIVTLQGTPLADTTDVTGVYGIAGRRVRTGGADTLSFRLNGQLVEKRAVETLTATVPDIQIVQRGFSGAFSTPAEDVGRVEGVVTGDGIAAGDSIVATFFYNPLADNYSGFIWFPPPSAVVRDFIVHVNVYDGNGLLTGRSPDVPFNSSAGNITIPAFDPSNLISSSGEAP